jgi:hypothetical protein
MSRVQPQFFDVDESTPNFKLDLRLICATNRVPESRRKLYFVTCARCGPRMHSSPYSHTPAFETVTYLTDLDPLCIVCDVVHQTHRSLFHDDPERHDSVRIYYKDEISYHVQIEFFRRFSQSESTYVQLYAKG